jgi:hypothetical protein
MLEGWEARKLECLVVIRVFSLQAFRLPSFIALRSLVTLLRSVSFSGQAICYSLVTCYLSIVSG